MMKNLLSGLFLIALFSVVLGSCSSSNVVSRGIIQKRKYNKGFFLKIDKPTKGANCKVANSPNLMDSNVVQVKRLVPKLHASKPVSQQQVKKQFLLAMHGSANQLIPDDNVHKSVVRFYSNTNVFDHSTKVSEEPVNKTNPQNGESVNYWKGYMIMSLVFFGLMVVCIGIAHLFYLLGMILVLAAVVFLITAITLAILARIHFKRTKPKKAKKDHKERAIFIYSGYIALGLALIVVALNLSSILFEFSISLFLVSVHWLAFIGAVVFGVIALVRFIRKKRAMKLQGINKEE